VEAQGFRQVLSRHRLIGPDARILLCRVEGPAAVGASAQAITGGQSEQRMREVPRAGSFVHRAGIAGPVAAAGRDSGGGGA